MFKAFTFAALKILIMKKLLLGFTILGTLTVTAQDETVKKLKDDANKTIAASTDTSNKLWKKGALLSLNIAQGSLSNWAAGGDNFSLSANLFINLNAHYKKDKHSWDNNLDINLGYVNTTSLGTRKNDDRIDLTSKYGYALNKKLNLTGLFNFRTQFFEGFIYPDANTKIFVSDFMAPAYILFGAGLDYKPNSEFSIFFSPITSRWVIVNNAILSAKGDYGVAPGKKVLHEIGAYASANYVKNINKLVTYRGRLDLFSNYKRNPQNIDVYMTNLLSVKLSKVLAATWSVDMIYDDDVKLFGPNKNAPGLQVKSIVGVGLLVKM